MNEKIQYVKISPKDAKEIMDNEESIVLDVRTKDEYDQGHIEGAVLLPVDEISSKAEEVLKDKKAKILVYCRSGNRSATSEYTLIKMGYENVLDFGGIIDWPYEIVTMMYSKNVKNAKRYLKKLRLNGRYYET